MRIRSKRFTASAVYFFARKTLRPRKFATRSLYNGHFLFYPPCRRTFLRDLLEIHISATSRSIRIHLVVRRREEGNGPCPLRPESAASFVHLTGVRLSRQIEDGAFVFFSVIYLARYNFCFYRFIRCDKTVPGYCHGLRIWYGQRARIVTAVVQLLRVCSYSVLHYVS